MKTLESWAIRIWHGLWLTIDMIIYWVMSLVYQVFYMITEVNLFDYDGAIGKLTERIYVVFGVVMLFVFAYNILLLLADPDKLNGKNNALSSIAKNTVISLVLVALLPTIFEYMYAIQYRVLSTNLIGNIILGGTSSAATSETDARAVLKSAGAKVSTTIFSTFYHPITEDGSDISPSDCVDSNNTASSLCQEYMYAMNTATVTGDISKFVRNDTLEVGLVNGKMRYLYIISSLCGVAAVYLFASFALDIGLRAVKLAVLQVVAPIPIMLRITKPTGGIFSRWFKEIKDTYVSLFVRLAIIYFAIFSIDMLVESYNAGSLFRDYGGLTALFAEVVLIISILAFAKEAPKLLKNLTGGAGGIEWNIKKKFDSDTYDYARRAMGAAGTVGGNLRNWGFNAITGRANNGGVRGLARGVFSGLKHGWQNSGGSISTLGRSVKDSVAQTQKEIENMNARNRRINQTREEMQNDTTNPVGALISKIPGIGRLVASGVLKHNDLHDAIVAEGGIENYLNNRINYTTSGAGAEAAGTFRKHHANIVDSEPIQHGIKNLKAQYDSEDEHTREYYNNLNLQLDARLRALQSTTEYAEYAKQQEEYHADFEALSQTTEYQTYSTKLESLKSSKATFETSYKAQMDELFAKDKALESQRKIIEADTSLDASTRTAQLAGIDASLSKNLADRGKLEAEKIEFDKKTNDGIKELVESEVGQKAANLQAREQALYASEVGKQITQINDERTSNHKMLKNALARTKAERDAAIDEQFRKNFSDNAQDIKTYFNHNISEITEEFRKIPFTEQSIILKNAGFDTSASDFNPNRAFAELGQMLQKNEGEKYTIEEVKAIRGFFKGLKKCENRGPFDYRMSRAQDARGEKKGGDNA